MIRFYRICGLSVSCDFRYGLMTSRGEKYLCDVDNPDITIDYSGEAMDRLRRIAPHLSDEECELVYTAEQFYNKLLNFDGFMLHSSAVEVDGRAYLFSAPSGTGKSTHTKLWLDKFGERAQIINDDKPAIRIEKDGIFAYGTPWSGKDDLSVNEGFPVAGICVLERSSENFITPMDEGQAIFSILNQTLRPSDPAAMSKLLELLDSVMKNVRVWKMGCNISPEAADMAYEVMHPQP